MLCNKILIVDDDESFLNIYKKILKHKNYNVEIANNSINAINVLKENNIDIVISDMYMPDASGIELIKEIKKLSPKTEIILVTGNASIDNAVESIKVGAYTYIQKPLNVEELLLNIKKIEEINKIKSENEFLKNEIVNKKEPFIGKSKSILEIKDLINKVAKSDSSILITGESGTGKEIVAKAIHEQSNRYEENLVKVNCSALSEGILESELFGHEKGSFTGATSNKIGRFEIANNGTLFLDEIGEISQSIQVKLLRVLQEKEFERVGGSKTVKANFRLISATNKNLINEIEKGNFREDLYYRLNVIPIEIPPLRNRKEDIFELIQYFTNVFARDLNKNKIKFTSDAIKILTEYNWPGNIRELKNIIERIMVLSNKTEIGLNDVFKYMTFDKKLDEDLKPYREAKKQFEAIYIEKALKLNSGNITKTAEFMGIARKNLQAKLKNLS